MWRSAAVPSPCPGHSARSIRALRMSGHGNGVFPATRFYVDGETGERRRHHLHESVLQRAVKDAVRAAGIPRPATCHSLRHSFATHLREAVRYPDDPGTAGASRHGHDDDLHARAQSGRACCAQPAGSAAASDGARVTPIRCEVLRGYWDILIGLSPRLPVLHSAPTGAPGMTSERIGPDPRLRYTAAVVLAVEYPVRPNTC